VTRLCIRVVRTRTHLRHLPLSSRLDSGGWLGVVARVSEATCGDSGPGCRFAHPGYEVLEHASSFSRLVSPELFNQACPSRIQRAQEVPDAGRTREPCVQRKCTLRTQASTGQPKHRHSLRNGLTAYTWSPRSTGPVSLRRLAHRSQDLIPASGNRDRTISPYASHTLRLARQRVHRIPAPTSVTTRTPLFASAGWRK
jgi:hypothetical protein